MPEVHIPAPMRSLTHGESTVTASGERLSEVIDDLESRFPGLKARLLEGDRLRPGMAVFINGVNAPSSLHARTPEDATIYFVPAISGGK